MPPVSDVRETFGSMSVVIPAYNAQDVVCRTLDSVQDYLDGVGLEHEIIVVDDGSSDGTAECVARRGRGVRLLVNDVNRGKGYTVRRGLRESRLAWAMFMDVDNATSIDHLERFAEHAAGAEVLIASRRVAGAWVRPQPRTRQFLGRAFPYLVRALALRGIFDSQCGFKVFRREVLEDLLVRQRSTGFCFDVEILLTAVRLGYRVAEIPVVWKNPPGRSTLRIGSDPLKMFVDLLRITWRHRVSRYR